MLRISLVFILCCAGHSCWSQVIQDQNAVQLIESAIARKAENDPALKLSYLSYEAYQNLKVAGDPEALTGPGYKKTELRKTLMRTKVLYAEKTSIHLNDPDEGYKEMITGTNMPGFKAPVYPIYTIKFQSENVYDKKYVILDLEFMNPLSQAGLKTYTYSISKDSVIQGRAVTKVSFYDQNKNNKNTLNGDLYIDNESGAVARARFLSEGILNIAANHGYEFNEEFDLWFPTSRELFIKKEKDKKELEIFGARLQVGTEKEKALKNPEDDLYLILKTTNSNFKNDPDQEYGREAVEIDILDSALEKDKNYWTQYRDKDALSNDDLASFMQLDSVVLASNITRKLETLDKFKVGYYPVGFFDIDLKYLVKYNDYEAFRLGIGGTTNEKLSESWRLGGYLAYGTKDRTFKYKMNVGYRIDKDKNTWLNIYKQDDINEFAAESFLTDARVYSLFEPRLINIPTFYLFKEHGISIQQRPFATVIGEVSLSRKRIVQTTSYIFQPENDPFAEYALTEAALGIRWSPLSKFMRTPRGYQETTAGYPVMSGQVTKGVSNVLDSDFDYLKLSGKMLYVIDGRDNQKTELSVEGHFASGDVPLTHLYHAYPNAPNKDEVLQRFSVAGRRSFETMYFNEFFSDRLLVSQVKHRFDAFNIASFLKPELVLISKFAIGDLDDRQQHINVDFDTLEHGYLESGFELNKLIFGFGLSASYRYGAYHLPDIEDNIAVKFTFYLEL